MNDPRDKQFFVLQKKGIPNLDADELALMMQYAKRMLKWVDSSKARRGWKELYDDASQRLNQLQGID